MQSPPNESLPLDPCSTLHSTRPNPVVDEFVPATIEASVVAIESVPRTIDESAAHIEGTVVTVAAVEGTVDGGDYQPAVADDSLDLRITAVSPSPAPFVPTVGAWAKPLKISLPSSASALSVPWEAGSNLFPNLSDPTQWPSLSVAQREGHTKNIATQMTSKTRDTQARESKADVIVAQDGTGNFTTVKEAVAAAPEHSKTRYIILVKKGLYDEIVHIEKKKTNITILGEGRDSTVLTGSLNGADHIKTFDSATLAVDGDGFMAQDICIKNTAGPEKQQAVALRVSGDKAVIYRCRIDAYQDTLYAHRGHHFYRDCYITGTVDFICGLAKAVYQYCQIEARKPGKGQSNMITAQKRETQSADSWFSFQKCSIRATPDLAPIKGAVKTFLGRPWSHYSTVVFMQSFIDDLIDPAGWAPWDSDKGTLSTLYYGEYQNKGPGAETVKRVKWGGFKIITDPKEAAKFTVRQLLQGESWLSSTGVPYEEGL